MLLEYNKATEKSTLLYNKKRIISDEVKLLKQNQVVVENFEELKKQHAHVYMLYNMWKLRNIDAKITEYSDEIKKTVASISEVNSRRNELSLTLAKKRALSSNALKESFKLTKLNDKHELDLNICRQKLTEISAQKKRLEDNLKTASSSLERSQHLYEKQVLTCNMAHVNNSVIFFVIVCAHY